MTQTAVTLHTFTDAEISLIERALQLAYVHLESSRDLLRVYRAADYTDTLKSTIEQDYYAIGELLLKIQASR